MPDINSSTYKSLIAQGILNELGIKMSMEQVNNALSEPQSFHRLVVRVEAYLKELELLMDQTLDMQNFVQTRLANLVFADFSLRAKEGEANDQEVTETMSGKMLNNMQNKFEEDAGKINRYKDELAVTKVELRELTRGLVSQFNKGNSANLFQEAKQSTNQKVELLLEKRKQYLELLQETFAASQSIENYLGKFGNSRLFQEIQKNPDGGQPAIEPFFKPG